MQKINNNELKQITAGASAGWITAAIIGGITFIAGIFDGITRPFKCR